MMIRRVTAIFFVLLANIILLAHCMIIHHHHDSLPVENSTFHEHNNDHSHHNENSHQYENPFEKEDDNPTKSQHKHDFPSHYHLSATGDLYFTQLSRSNLAKQIQPTISIILYGTDCNELKPPPERRYVVNCDLPFLITTLYKPGALALRGPPSII